jgi:hypothetical protein
MNESLEGYVISLGSSKGFIEIVISNIVLSNPTLQLYMPVASSISPARAQPPCALCEREGHPTNRCPTLLELRNLIQLPKATPLLATPQSTSTVTTDSSTTRKKGLQTNFSCAICSEYGHYTHHCPGLPQFWKTLAAIRHTSRPEPSPTLPTEAHITDIRYISSLVPERTRYHP